MNHTDLDLILADLMFPILVDLAPRGETIGYKEIADLVKQKNPNVVEIANITQRHIGRKLGTIWEFTKSQGCPHIGSLVVTKDGECGTGITGVVKDLPEEREKVKEFDWSTVTLNFGNFIKKAKLKKAEREAKKKKLSREDAKANFIAYWKSIKDQAPISRDEAIQMKERIFKLVQQGYTPEEAFAKELLSLLSHKDIPQEKNGFVYIGEYVSSESKEPLFSEVKIGFTRNLEQRASDLGGGVIGPLEFTMKHHWEFEPGVAFAVEQALHGKFSQYRTKGEFFDDEDGLLPELVDDEITISYEGILIGTNYD